MKATPREKESTKALRRLHDALWEWNMPTDPPKAVNNAYIAAGDLLRKITTEQITSKL